MSNITRRVKMCEEDHCRWFLDPGSLAPWIDRFGAELADRRYSRLTISGYTDAARHFAAWVNSTSTPIQMVDADLLRRFADHRCECPGGRRWSRISPKYFRRAKRFYTFLQDIAVAPAPASLPLAPVHPLLDDYQRWLRIHRGLSERTIARHRRLLTNLLPTLGEAIRDYNAGLIRSVVREWRERTGPADLRTITSALRSYLRFLAAAGLCRPNLDHAISPVVQWRLSSLPRYLSANDVERVVASCDQLSNGRLRDRAILLLLARLGLRAGDVTALKLQDLDWAQERLALRQELSAPLVADLEEWMRDNRSKLSKNSDVAEAMDYMLKAWPAFTAFLGDGRICLTNNAAERALRGHSSWQKITAIRWVRPRRSAHRLHAEPHRHGEAQRHRSAGLARRHSRAHRRHSPEPSP
jgi:site-specific recombinase XerD